MDWLGELTEFPFLAPVWGTVGQWVSGLGSTAAFFLGFSILLRDRRHRQRAQAEQVSCWFNSVGDEDRVIDIWVKNYSANDIYRVALGRGKHGKRTRAAGFQIIDIKSRLGPGEEIQVRHDLGLHWSKADVAILFADTAGLYWQRDMVTMVLRRIGRSRRPQGSPKK